VEVQHRELVGQALRRTTKWEFNTVNSWGKRWADDQVGVQHDELVGQALGRRRPAELAEARLVQRQLAAHLGLTPAVSGAVAFLSCSKHSVAGTTTKRARWTPMFLSLAVAGQNKGVLGCCPPLCLYT